MKTNLYVIDTNYLYSFFNLDDPNYERSIKLFSDLDDNSKFILPQIAIAELVVAGNDEFLMFKTQLFNTKFTNNTIEDLDYINSLSKEIKRPLKAIDCLILALCKRYNAKLLTFDKKLQKAHSQLFD